MYSDSELLLKVVRSRIKDLSHRLNKSDSRVITRMIGDPTGHSVLLPLFIHNVRTCVSPEKNEFNLEKKKEKIIKGIKTIAHTWGWFFNCMEKESEREIISFCSFHQGLKYDPLTTHRLY